uniref:rRNA biogenesis protein RRP36 n=1 Tax=Plectus sambesii TaxID=2011161 RepID=A0A914WMD4_9BILA
MENERRTFPKKFSGTTAGYAGQGDLKKRKRSTKLKQEAEAMAKHTANNMKEKRRDRRALASKAKIKAPSGANMIPLGTSSMRIPQKDKWEKKQEEKRLPQHKSPADDAQKTMVDYLASYNDEEGDDDEMEDGEEQTDAPGDEDDGINDEFREEIANMPLSEVMALRDKLGLKLYDKAVFGADPVTSSSVAGQEPFKRKVFSRDHAKRPREMSSKRPVSKFRNIYPDQKLTKTRLDPRFDERCGEFDDYIFAQNYSFVKDIRSQEKNLLKTEMQKLRKVEPEKSARIKDIVTRIENQERSESLMERKKDRIRQLRADNMDRLRQGKNPFFMKKSELKREELTERFEKLQNKGKLDKYLKRKTKKGMRAAPGEGGTQQFAFDDSD